ncbi:palindromic element RPE4 domain-containing protein [Rickettsia asembonensis]|nr:palindromic element RPE4 domain-containing protein [Rickettsia asembonensis]
MSSRGLTTGSRKNNFYNINDFNILSWIPRSSRGMTQLGLDNVT